MGVIRWRQELIRKAFTSNKPFAIRLGEATPDFLSRLPSSVPARSCAGKSLTVNQTWLDRKRKDGRLAMTGRGGKDDANEVVYWLVHKVRTRHDPHAMPTQKSQLNAATAAVRIAVLKILAKRDPRASM